MVWRMRVILKSLGWQASVFVEGWLLYLCNVNNLDVLETVPKLRGIHIWGVTSESVAVVLAGVMGFSRVSMSPRHLVPSTCELEFLTNLRTTASWGKIRESFSFLTPTNNLKQG